MRRIAKFAAFLQAYVPKKKASGVYHHRRKAKVTIGDIVAFLVARGRLTADRSTGIVYRRRTKNCHWKKLRPYYDRDGREMGRLYATIRGVKVRVGTTLAKIAYLIYHGPRSIPRYHDIDHKDENRENNRLDNLVPLWYNKNRSSLFKTTGDTRNAQPSRRP